MQCYNVGGNKVNNNKEDNEQISLKLDVVFKQFFSKKGNEVLLEDFLSIS